MVLHVQMELLLKHLHNTLVCPAPTHTHTHTHMRKEDPESMILLPWDVLEGSLPHSERCLQCSTPLPLWSHGRNNEYGLVRQPDEALTP